jgi:hypothetical protein
MYRLDTPKFPEFSYNPILSFNLNPLSAEQTLPRNIQTHLHHMAVEETLPFLLLKNCPITHDSHQKESHKKPLEELFALGLMKNLYCQPFCEKYEEGAFMPLISLKGYGVERFLLERQRLFDWHTDHLHFGLEEGVHFLILFCIQGEPTVQTELLLIDECVKELPSSVVKDLQKPVFQMRTDPQRVGAILQSDFQGGFYIQYSQDVEQGIKAQTEEGSKALRYFTEYLNEAEPYQLTLEKGDCFMINNQKVLHRYQICDFTIPEKTHRWVQRLHLQINYQTLVQETFSREKT